MSAKERIWKESFARTHKWKQRSDFNAEFSKNKLAKIWSSFFHGRKKPINARFLKKAFLKHVYTHTYKRSHFNVEFAQKVLLKHVFRDMGISVH